MSMKVENDKLIIDFPNTEATLNAQHNGCKDRYVGSFYMSEIQTQVYEFLNNFDGEFYVDILKTYTNLMPLINRIIEEKAENCFKKHLDPQKSSLKTIEMVIKKGNTLHKIQPPFTNDQQKYLKFTIEDSIFNEIKDLCLGELTRLVIRKLSCNCFVIYGESNDSLDYKIKNNILKKWYV